MLEILPIALASFFGAVVYVLSAYIGFELIEVWLDRQINYIKGW